MVLERGAKALHLNQHITSGCGIATEKVQIAFLQWLAEEIRVRLNQVTQSLLPILKIKQDDIVLFLVHPSDAHLNSIPVF